MQVSVLCKEKEVHRVFCFTRPSSLTTGRVAGIDLPEQWEAVMVV